MKKIIGIQKILFLVWTICLAVVFQIAITANTTHMAILVSAFLAGVISFAFVWLISITQFVFDKHKLNATKLPILSVAITLLFVLGLHTMATPVIQPEQVVAEVKTAPGPTISPSPTAKPVVAAKKNTTPQIECVGPDGKHFSTTQKECDNLNAAWGSTAKTSGACKDPSGNIIADEKCPWLAGNNTNSNNSGQPSNDYYVPSYIYEPVNTGYTYSNYPMPEPPTYSTYQPNYPTANIENESWPTLGPSVPIQNNCETYTTNAGSITVCK